MHLRLFSRVTSLVLLGSVALGGCAWMPSPAHQVDGLFGTSVRHTIAAQTANPDASRKPRPPDTFDAQTAVAALARHRASFKTPPPTFNIIGVTSGGE